MSVFERLEGDPDSPLVLTCEHASNALPAGYSWHDDDRWLVDTHWAVDLGIADVTRALAASLRAPALLAGFSRLLCDVNRPVDAETTFRAVAEGRAIRLNAGIDDAERGLRARSFHEPYHAAADDLLVRYPRAVVLSMHSFTPIYEDAPPRWMEIGVLFDREEEVSARIGASMAEDGWKVAMNEPYSGKDGLIYSADRHATRHGRRALELEVRNDVARDLGRRDALVASLRRALLGALT